MYVISATIAIDLMKNSTFSNEPMVPSHFTLESKVMDCLVIDGFFLSLSTLVELSAMLRYCCTSDLLDSLDVCSLGVGVCSIPPMVLSWLRNELLGSPCLGVGKL